MARVLKLRSGALIPTIGLGTWKSAPGEVGAAVARALDVGYRHLDCAHIYANEGEIGNALTAFLAGGKASRDEIFVTSKLWLNSFHPDDVMGACQTTLKNLRLDYVDLYLTHWPVGLPRDAPSPAAGPIPMDQRLPWDVSKFVDTWKAMEKLVERGLARNIGVSNFTVKKLTEFLAHDLTVLPAVNQGILFQAYSPLGSPDRPAKLIDPNDPVPLKDPIILKIAEKHKCKPAQVLISWAIHRQTVVLPKSVNLDRIAENFGSYDVKLDEDDMKQLEALECNCRFIKAQFLLLEGQTVDEFWDNE